MFYFVAHINQVDHDDSKEYKGSIYPPANKTSREVAKFHQEKTCVLTNMASKN